jgi:hypothetical protein
MGGGRVPTLIPDKALRYPREIKGELVREVSQGLRTASGERA